MDNNSEAGMTKDEALDLALRSLKELVPDESDYAPAIQGQRKRQEKAITAIKQARALDKKAENARELGLDYEPDYKVTVVDDQHPNGVPLEQWGRPAPVQEPVAWAHKEGLEKINDFDASIYARGGFDDAVPLYINPPAQPTPADPFVAEDVALKNYLKDCEDHMIDPDVGGAFHFAWNNRTPPAAQRQWVGLTDDERGKVYADWRWSDGGTSNLALCEAIEAKLKEKNT
jgi:hypothetical protein